MQQIIINSNNMQDAKDTIEVLLRQEIKFYQCRNYVSRPRSPTSKDDSLSKSPSVVDVQCLQQHQQIDMEDNDDSLSFWRQQMIDWACMVVDSFTMDRDLVTVAFSMLDRYVAHELEQHPTMPLTRDDFQLFSMTCLYLAIKINEPYPRKLGLEALVDMSRGFYSASDIALTESDILNGLQWHTSPPTAHQFSQLFAQVLFPQQPLSVTGQRTCVTLTELALADPWFLDYNASTVGLASLWHAARLEGCPVEAGWDELAQVMPLQDNNDLVLVYRQLERLYCQ
jgi:hypothetical protein